MEHAEHDVTHTWGSIEGLMCEIEHASWIEALRDDRRRVCRKTFNELDDLYLKSFKELIDVYPNHLTSPTNKITN
jgi:hypothetical protein